MASIYKNYAKFSYLIILVIAVALYSCSEEPDGRFDETFKPGQSSTEITDTVPEVVEEEKPQLPEIVINEKLLGKWRCKTNVVLSSGNFYNQTLDWVDLFFNENGECYFKYQIEYSIQGISKEPSVVVKESKVYMYSASYDVIKIFDEDGFCTEVQYVVNREEYTLTVSPIDGFEFFPIRRDISVNLPKEELESFVYTQYGVERIDPKLAGRWHCELNIGTNGGNTYSEGISWLDVEFDKYGECSYFWQKVLYRHQSEFTWDGEERWNSTTYYDYESDTYTYTTIDGILKVHNEKGFDTQVEYNISGDTLTLTQRNGFASYPAREDLYGYEMPTELEYIKIQN